MTRLLLYIRQRLSLRLGLLIILIVTVGFVLVLDTLFYQYKQYVHQAAIDRATQLLDNTVARIDGIMDETEVVTNYMAITTPYHLQPDSLLAFTRRTVTDNTFLTGFAISMEPHFFPEMGRYFSAYTVRQDDTITTVREAPFEYFEKVWYKTPHNLGKSCWVGAFDDYNEGTLSAHDFLTSYCCPMRNTYGQFIGSITASLSLKWLSKAVTAIDAYPHSSAIMIDQHGTYIVHPDTAKLYRESIFSDPDSKAREDINILGRDMLAGHSGVMRTIVDGGEAYIFYRPLVRTSWSIAIVCPASDVFRRYHQLLYTVWTITGVGLLLLLLFCFLTIRGAMKPLQQLAWQAGLIVDGHFDEPLPPSTRKDSVGRLTNSFIRMRESLAESVANTQKVNEELERRNQELIKAYQLKIDADEHKTTFLQDMSHQIRTPLNIISGFVQVIGNKFNELPEEEVADITLRMKNSARTINHITRLLSTASIDNGRSELSAFSCNDLCREAVAKLSATDGVSVNFETTLRDGSDTITSDRQALLFILDELLDNANKFTHKGSITLSCNQAEGKVVFAVTDTGNGIPKDKHKYLFEQFAKFDMFTDGLGLGLYLCKKTANLIGCEIRYDETWADGSRFLLTLSS